MSSLYLLGIDVEGIGAREGHMHEHRDNIVGNLEKYLSWLEKYKFSATFFVVGSVAREYPEAIKGLALKGHEIACHSNDHRPLTEHTKESFKKDLYDNIEALTRAGGTRIMGYRAPVFSCNYQTQWAYELLFRMGIRYSSSVLPVQNPLFGWPSYFKDISSNIISGVHELPITVGISQPLKNLPIGGGVYFRVIPFFVLKTQLKKVLISKKPLVGYFHPYDIDFQQERFMRAGISENKFFNWLLYMNRDQVFRRLDETIKLGYCIDTYRNYVAKLLDTATML